MHKGRMKVKAGDLTSGPSAGNRVVQRRCCDPPTIQEASEILESSAGAQLVRGSLCPVALQSWCRRPVGLLDFNGQVLQKRCLCADWTYTNTAARHDDDTARN